MCWIGSVLKYCKVPEYYDPDCKTIRQAENTGSNIFVNKDTKIHEELLSEKNVNLTTQKHAFKGYESTYNVKFLNSFSSEL